MGANPFGLSLPLEWCSHFVELAATWGMSVEVATLTRRFQAWDQDLGATTMNDKGDDRRIALEHRAGVGAPDADAGPALIADQAAGFEPLDSSPWADIGLCVLRSILENRLLATAGWQTENTTPSLALITPLSGLTGTQPGHLRDI
jgi:hypothetical protein